MQQQYIDFHLAISKGSDQAFLVEEVLDPRPASRRVGRVGTLQLPYRKQALKLVLQGIESELRYAPGHRGGPQADDSTVLEFGRSLFDALLSGEIRDAYDRRLGEAIEAGSGLRLKLDIQVPSLVPLPWELLYDQRRGEYLVLSRDTSLVRYLEPTQPPRPTTVRRPLRILGLACSPVDLPPLQIEREKQRIAQALSGLRERELVELHWLENQTAEHLRQALLDDAQPWHVLHFIGHGEFDEASGEGAIILADGDGLAARLSTTMLASLLCDHDPLRLVLMNACEGAKGDDKSIFSSSAAVLVRRGLPAVLAMQYEISDGAAIGFSQSFYGAIASGLRADAAIAEARKAVSLASAESAEWAIPAFYMSLPNGELFTIEPAASPAGTQPLQPVVAAPPAASGPPPSNLPSNLTPLIGREREVTEIKAQIRDPDVRLTTLIGPGGTGKTRLGIEAARLLLLDFADGVYLVQLAAVSNPELLMAAIAQALGVHTSSDQQVLVALQEHLRGRHMLLLVDNFEQLLDAGPLLAQLLHGAPQLEMLVTSRATLNISGEHLYAVEPLGLPNLRRLPTIPQALLQYPAVRLFVERAEAAKRGFELNEKTMALIAEICVRLDGLPLAIELAAARVKNMPLPLLHSRLDKRLALLTDGARDLPERQRTLRGAIDWSYAMLAPAEQELFARLATFVGGCDYEAAEAVCAAEGNLGVDAFDGLASLVDKSLLRSREDADGNLFYAMLETLREYGLEKQAASGKQAAIELAHGAYFAAYAETAEPELTGPEQVAWYRQVEARHGNLWAALERAIDRDDAEVALRIGGALWRFWDTQGVMVKDARLRIERALTLPSALNVAPSIRAKTLHGAGVLAWSQGDYSRSKAYLDEGRLRFEQLDDQLGVARSLITLGLVARAQREYQQATSVYEQCLAILQALDHQGGVAVVLGNLGLVAFDQNKLEQAASYHEQSLAIERRLGNMSGESISLANLGEVALGERDYTKAEQYYKDSLVLRQQLDDRHGNVYCLVGLAGIAQARGQSERAARLWGAVEKLQESLGMALAPTDQESLALAITTAQAQSDPALWQAAWTAGRQLTIEQAITEALGEPIADQ